MTALLEVDGLTVSTTGGRTLLDSLTLRVERGESLAVLGASGAGKSTLLDALLGLNAPGLQASGRIVFDGRVLSVQSAFASVRGRRIALVPQDPTGALDPLMKIGKQVGEVVRLGGETDRKRIRRRCVDLLDSTGLRDAHDVVNRRAHELSGGMKQRVVLAMAIALDPDLLLVDEPTSSLDALARREAIDLLRSVRARTSCSMVVVTHDSAVSDALTDRSVHLQSGRLVDPAVHGGGVEKTATTEIRSKASNAISAASGTRANAVLETKDLSRWFGSTLAVDRVSLRVARGETVAVVGQSGSGKSTLARLVCGLVTPSSGAVELSGSSVGTLGVSVHRRVQLVLQDPYSSLDPRWRVRRIVAEPLRAQRRWDATSNDKVIEALEAVGLDATYLDRYPSGLSGGQRQRVAVARALVVEPELMVLDEPTSALDADVRDELVEAIARLQSQRNMTCLFVSHDLETVRSIAHRVVVMLDGRVVETGVTEKIFDSPEHPYTKKLVAATPAS